MLQCIVVKESPKVRRAKMVCFTKWLHQGTAPKASTRLMMINFNCETCTATPVTSKNENMGLEMRIIGPL